LAAKQLSSGDAQSSGSGVDNSGFPGDGAATGVIKVAGFNAASGAHGRYAGGQPTAAGTRWAP